MATAPKEWDSFAISDGKQLVGQLTIYYEKDTGRCTGGVLSFHKSPGGNYKVFVKTLRSGQKSKALEQKIAQRAETTDARGDRYEPAHLDDDEVPF